jgi:RNA polymerase sigma-70 factor, ECF subfamily
MSYQTDDLWNKIIHGDEKSFDQLFCQLYSHLCGLSQRILNDFPEAEETVQDVFIELWKNRLSIAIKSSVKNYLYQMVHHASINKLEHLQTKKNIPNKLVSEEQWLLIQNLYTVDNSFIAAYEARETEEIILKAIDELPEKCRQVFLLNRYENYSYEEIAEKLNLSQNTIRVQIFRALKYLKNYIDKINP